MVPKLERLADLAERMDLTIAQAVALSAAVNVGAKSVSMTDEAFLKVAEDHVEVREYISDVCKRAVGQMNLRLV